MRALWGVFAFALGRADLYRAAELADQIALLAEGSPEPSFAAAGHLAVGGVAMLMGRLDDARSRLEQGKALCGVALDLSRPTWCTWTCPSTSTAIWP